MQVSADGRALSSESSIDGDLQRHDCAAPVQHEFGAAALVHNAYVPLAIGCPFTWTSVEKRTVAGLPALGVHGRPHSTTSPNGSRPWASGRL